MNLRSDWKRIAEIDFKTSERNSPAIGCSYQIINESTNGVVVGVVALICPPAVGREEIGSSFCCIGVNGYGR